ncbi:MAG TPA: hypothetical protein DD713_01320 [Nitrospiraceae bacterium]|nr:hypothetical protein [Nitrospiraceae bacterium]
MHKIMQETIENSIMACDRISLRSKDFSVIHVAVKWILSVNRYRENLFQILAAKRNFLRAISRFSGA